MITGIDVRPINRLADERGFFSEITRTDWKETQPEEITQINLSHSYPGMIRAWHRHNRGQVDHFTVLFGAIKLCAYDDDKKSKTHGELDEIILSSESPKLVRIPGYLWHGFKALGVQPTTLLYNVNQLFDYGNPDEERRPWDDPSIKPSSINGRRDDPRVDKPWDWNYPPHR
jgi:dTDP-4-dehydrorhamnose 3,5-epimerase